MCQEAPKTATKWWSIGESIITEKLIYKDNSNQKVPYQMFKSKAQTHQFE